MLLLCPVRRQQLRPTPAAAAMPPALAPLASRAQAPASPAVASPGQLTRQRWQQHAPPRLQRRMHETLATLVWHTHVARHQAAEWRRLLDGLQPGEVALSMDFSENASFAPNRSPQSNYWGKIQATILSQSPGSGPATATAPSGASRQSMCSSPPTATTRTGVCCQQGCVACMLSSSGGSTSQHSAAQRNAAQRSPQQRWASQATRPPMHRPPTHRPPTHPGLWSTA